MSIVPATDDPRERDPLPWKAPAVRSEALVLSWAMMTLGHVLVALIAAFAVAGGTPDRSGAVLAACLSALVLGGVGALVAWHGLRLTVSGRRAERDRRPPATPVPQPLVPAIAAVVLAVGLGIIVVAQWGAGGILPAVAGELVFIPLALRTQHYLDDVRESALPWR